VTHLLASLTNRIFLASALLAVLSIGVAFWLVNVTVTSQAERELRRGLEEAGTLVEQYRALAVSQLAQQARLVADLPKFKAAVELDHPPTLAPLAADYARQITSALFLVVGRSGDVLADEGSMVSSRAGVERWPALEAGRRGQESTWFLPRADGVLQVVTVPIYIDPAAPDILGTLSVGVLLDEEFATQVKRLTDSEIAFVVNGRVRASTLPALLDTAVGPWLDAGDGGSSEVGDEEFVSLVRPLAGDVPGPRPLRQVAGPDEAGAASPAPVVLVLRSRSERLRPLRALHTALGATALLAVLVATLLSYFVARTVTRPLGAITAAMRDLASTGDLTRRLALPATSPWDDEDARLLASTLNTMAASLGQFQQEVAQRERLSSLGRLSTVIAHEIRNPLMIIKAALRTLRRAELPETRLAAAVSDIDGEVDRLNRLVNDVLDFARPIRFEIGPASLRAICEGAIAAAEADGGEPACHLVHDPAADAIVTDAERLRQALINLLANARQATRARAAGSPEPGEAPLVQVSTHADGGDRIRIRVVDGGSGIEGDALRHVFEPYFTTKRTGTGIGLAITRNIIDGLGGTIDVRSRAGAGTEVLVDLPRVPPAAPQVASS
jgi:signal transduction histidine kinase